MQWETTTADSRQPTAEPCKALTAREQDVAPLLGEYTEQEIADRLCVTRDTVKDHARSIRKKLGVRTSREAGRVYREKFPQNGG